MGTITKKDLIREIHKDEKICDKTVRKVLESFFKRVVWHNYSGDRVEIRNFGVFSAVLRKQKIGRNPKKSKDAIIIPERYRLKFSAGTNVNKLFENKSVNG